MGCRHVQWQKIKVQDPQGPASSIHFRILGSQGPASNIHFRILGSQGPMSSIHFRILGFQGPTSSIHFRIQGSQDPTSGTQFRILGSQGPMTSINFRIQSPQGPTSQSPQDPTSTHFRIQNPQDPMTSRYALQDTMFPRSHEFMAYLLQLSAFNLSPKAYHLQPLTTTYNLPPAGWVRKVVLFFYNSSFWSPIVRAIDFYIYTYIHICRSLCPSSSPFEFPGTMLSMKFCIEWLGSKDFKVSRHQNFEVLGSGFPGFRHIFKF